jgi:hypothetical protein
MYEEGCLAAASERGDGAAAWVEVSDESLG